MYLFGRQDRSERRIVIYCLAFCMSDLAWRRTAQAHQTIRSVHEGQHKRIDQSEASTRDSTSASTNQKRPQRTAKCTNQSHSFHEAEKARRSSNQIRMAGSKADASSHQTEASARPLGFIGRTIFGLVGGSVRLKDRQKKVRPKIVRPMNPIGSGRCFLL